MEAGGYHPRRVPRAEEAIVQERRLVGYLLNPDHVKGRHKARVLASLGFDEETADDLRNELLRQLPYVEGNFSEMVYPGVEAWTAHITIRGPTGEGRMLTVWAVEIGRPTRLLSIYPA